MVHRLYKLAGMLVALSAVAHAGNVDIGLISFDLLIPGGGTAGVNAFDISNFTGGFALPSTFLVVTPLTFTLTSLELMGSAGPQTVPLGSVAPGPFIPPASLQFASTVTFSSATLSGTLSETSFLLSDGSTLVLASPNFQALLAPSSGNSLTAGADFALISVSNVPEPSSYTLVLSALIPLGIGLGQKRRHHPANS